MCSTTRSRCSEAFTAGELDRDVVVVVRFQGPRANGMPELHSLTPALAVLQKRGHRVALVTDGRMSGASGTVPGRDPADAGMRLRRRAGARARRRRDPARQHRRARSRRSCRRSCGSGASRRASDLPANGHGHGRELFAGFRALATDAESERSGMQDNEHPRHHAALAGHPGADRRCDSNTRCRWPGRWCAGGIGVLEVTLRSACALAAIRAMRSAVPEAVVGAGTLTRAEDFAAAERAGAQFGVTPGLTPELAAGRDSRRRSRRCRA